MGQMKPPTGTETEALSEGTEFSSPGMVNFLLLFFHVSLPVLLPCHSTMKYQISLYQSLLKPLFSAHFGYRLYQLISMYACYLRCMYSDVCSSLFSRFTLCLSLRGFDAFSRKNNSSLELRMKIDTFFIPLIGTEIRTLPV